MADYNLDPNYIAFSAIPKALHAAGYTPSVDYHQCYYAGTRGGLGAVQDRTRHWFLPVDRLAVLARRMRLGPQIKPVPPAGTKRPDPQGLTQADLIPILRAWGQTGALSKLIVHRILSALKGGFAGTGPITSEDLGGLLSLATEGASEVMRNPEFAGEWEMWRRRAGQGPDPWASDPDDFDVIEDAA